MTSITDKVQIRNGADFTFICKKVPFAITCSSVRSVGYISQTIQCVRNGKISGNIHIQGKVIRDLYSIFDVDCIASSRTYTHLVGKPPKPPEDTKVPDLDDNVGDTIDIEEEDDGKPICDAKCVIDPTYTCDEKGVIDSAKKEKDDTKTNDDATNETKEDGKIKYDKAYLNYVSSLPVYQPPQMTLREWRKVPKFGTIKNVMTYETSPGDCVQSSSEDDQTDLDDDEEDDINDDPQDQYQNESSGYGYRDPEPGETFCNFCFVSGQPVRVTHSHNILDVACPSMSHMDKERIHGPNWLAKMHGYND